MALRAPFEVDLAESHGPLWPGLLRSFGVEHLSPKGSRSSEIPGAHGAKALRSSTFEASKAITSSILYYLYILPMGVIATSSLEIVVADIHGIDKWLPPILCGNIDGSSYYTGL